MAQGLAFDTDATTPLMAYLPGGPVAENGGEYWQYMGTAMLEGMGRCHEFRHRCHPWTGKRELVRWNVIDGRFYASRELVDADRERFRSIIGATNGA